MVLNEAYTCRIYIVTKIEAVDWDNEPHRVKEQVTFTYERISVSEILEGAG